MAGHTLVYKLLEGCDSRPDDCIRAVVIVRTPCDQNKACYYQNRDNIYNIKHIVKRLIEGENSEVESISELDDSTIKVNLVKDVINDAIEKRILWRNSLGEMGRNLSCMLAEMKQENSNEEEGEVE